MWLRIYWGDGCGEGGYCHNAMRHLFDTDDPKPEATPGGIESDYAEDQWPTRCEECGVIVPPMPEREPCPCGCGQLRRPEHAPHRQVFRKTLYATSDRSFIGMPTTGDCYYADWYGCADEPGVCIHGWTNCDGRHLIVHVPDSRDPDGWWWDTNGRASNCTLKEDTLHRCWIVRGSPADGTLDVSKAGLTCSAGGGSIQTPRWHGVLHDGKLRGC